VERTKENGQEGIEDREGRGEDGESAVGKVGL